jgi:hypothetical protein
MNGFSDAVSLGGALPGYLRAKELLAHFRSVKKQS